MACSGLAFHVLYDSSGADLERIRAGSVVDGAALVAHPYAVSEDVPQDNGWARGRGLGAREHGEQPVDLAPWTADFTARTPTVGTTG